MTSTAQPDLHTAAAQGDLRAVRALIDAGADIDARDLRGRTPLVRAIDRGRVELGDAVRDAMAGKPMQEIRERSAPDADYPGVIRLLVERGADLELPSDTGNTPLVQAARAGDRATLELLLSRGVDVDATTNDGRTALMYAVINGNVDVAALFAQGRSRAPASDSPDFPLASTRDRGALARLLLDAGADVNCRSPRGETALGHAVVKGLADVAELLLERGAHPDPVDARGYTPLLWALQHHQSAGLAVALLAHGADVNARTAAGLTALLLAIRRDRSEMVARLLERGADPAARDPETGWRALHLAAALGRTEAAEALLEAGGDPDGRDDLGRTPLWLAVYGGHAAAARLLLGRRADAETEDATGRSPRAIAAERGDPELIGLFGG